MGRRSWATPEQLEYLKSFIPLLQQAKGTTGLMTLYGQVSDGFQMKWTPEPIVPKPNTSLSPEQLAAEAKKRLEKVSVVSDLLSFYTHAPPAHQILVFGRAEEGKIFTPPIL
jgi:hypothetical protein